MAASIQSPSMGALIVLYQLDTTNIGGPIYYFTGTTNPDGSFIQFDGNSYAPIPIETAGWEWNGKGSLPRPRVKLSNVNKTLQGAVNEFSDLLGCKFTRIRTLAEFLETGDNPNPDATMPIDVYVVERKVAQNKVFIEWELAASVDQEGKNLPGRQILKDACTHIYRTWNGSSFDYANATCPYAGTNYFLQSGVTTTNPALDRCGKRLSDCRLRFGQNNPLYTRAFPGVGAY
ncbi:MAG: phage minor tail protein L [Smithella sp.]